MRRSMTNSTGNADRTGRRPALRRATRVLLSTACALALLAVAAPSAFAVFSHDELEFKFPANANCERIRDIVTLEPEGMVYIWCITPEGNQIERFHLNGEPAAFTGVAPYISGNTLTADPGSSDGTFQNRSWLAVDSSSSLNHGRLFVASDPNVDVFNFDGTFAFPIVQKFEGFTNITAIDVGPDGDIYVHSPDPQGRISKYTPGGNEIERLYTFCPCGYFPGGYIRVDNHGGLWESLYEWYGISSDFELRKWEPDQFTTELRPQPFGPSAEPRYQAEVSPYVEPNPLIVEKSVGPFPPEPTLAGIDVDLSTDELIVNRTSRIESYSRGTAAEHAYRTAPPFGEGEITDSEGLSVTKDHHVYASTEEAEGPEVAVFGPGDVLPDVHTFAPKLSDIDHTEVTTRGKIELAQADGGTPITDCKVEYGDKAAGNYNLGSAQCSPDAAESPPGSNYTEDREVSAELTGLTTGETYHYRLVAENEKGVNYGKDQSVIPPFVLETQTLPADQVNTGGARLNASMDPDGIPTEFKFEYGVTDHYGFSTPLTSAGSGSGLENVNATLSGLPSGRTFHYRIVAEASGGKTYGDDMTFRTASTPVISGVDATEVTANSAVLHAQINPVGFETEYLFEYGSTPEYGNKIPVSLESVGAGSEPVEVTQKITGLTSGITYHYRVIAKNEWGSAESPDTTFDFAPPTCPNAHVRQQTTASYLPDCRAYELVSPSVAGAALLEPSDWAAHRTTNEEYSRSDPWIQNRGFATSPSRFSYWSAISTVKDSHSPVGLSDMYMATRTNQGWVTGVPGWQNNDAYETGRKICSETQELCIDHSASSFAGYTPDGSPLVASASGKYIMRLPTNLSIISSEHPKIYFGGVSMSGNFNHYVFSSSDFTLGSLFPEPTDGPVFAPGGLHEGLGSAYDNDIGARTVNIISKMPNGTDIMLEGPKELYERGFDFPGISPDGSHILMQTPATEGSVLVHLFMRVTTGVPVTYDISRGAAVHVIGMTRSGDKVYFTTTESLVPADTDTSTDVYMWQENGEHEADELSVISQGNGHGNTDECSASGGWTSKCGAVAVSPEREHPNENLAVSMPGQDDVFAEDSGDIYFYSPELLDPLHPGIENEKNLYLYRNGAIQLVSTLDAGTSIDRMQISPNGRRGAFLTKSQMTGDNTEGYEQVYTYDADTRIIRCASCHPDGTSPTADASVSEGGRFMANDGRTFFSTKDPLVPRDRNGNITDVYEYVDGRPQLITSGIGGKDFTGGSEVLSLFLSPEYTGLEAVSRDGTDVYFSTFDTLVKSDLNGEFVKFYDARTGGGFPEEPELAPCAAADECHGADSSAPVAPVVSSDINLGVGGNVVNNNAGRKGSKSKHKKAKRRHKGKHRKKHRKRSGKRGKRNHRSGKRAKRKHHRSARKHSRPRGRTNG